MTNDELYDQAKKAIDELYSDMSVSQETTIENLETLIAEMEIMIDALEEDMDHD